MKEISSEDADKLQDLNERVKRNIHRGDYGTDDDLDHGTIDDGDRESMTRRQRKLDVMDLTSHVDKILDSNHVNQDGD